MDLVKEALRYYDKNNEKFGHLVSKVKYYQIIKNFKDMEKFELILYDDEQKELVRSKLEYIGFFNNQSNTWVWAWANPQAYKNQTYLSRKVINYGMDLEPNKDNYLLKTELLTSRFSIDDPTQLDFHLSVFSYLTKKPYVFEFVVNPEISTTNEGILEYNIKKSKSTPSYRSTYILLLDDIDI